MARACWRAAAVLGLFVASACVASVQASPLLADLLADPEALAAELLPGHEDGIARPKDVFVVTVVPTPTVSAASLKALLARQFDIWSVQDESTLNVYGDVALLELICAVHNLKCERQNFNVEAAIAAERARLARNKALSRDVVKCLCTIDGSGFLWAPATDWFLDYHPWEEALEWYRDIAAQNPDLVTYIDSVGQTWENRSLAVVRINAPNGRAKKQVYIQSNIHAREWITSATLQYFFNYTVYQYGKDARVTDLLNQIELHLVPFVNPDGFSFTWTNDRLWRKNRRNNGNSYGVDLNRNWDDHWGGEGSSGTPSSDTYRGPSPASEPETQALARYYDSLTNVIAALDLHSYSQLILYPYSWQRAAAPTGPQLKTLADAMREVIRQPHGKSYTSGQWYTALYPSSGVSMDYFHEQNFNGIRPYAYTFELRPTTSIPGFQLPPEEIIPSGEEVTPTVLYMMEYALANPIPYVA